MWNTILGRFSWSPPCWLVRLSANIVTIARRRPWLSAATVVSAIALIAAGALTWRWYERQPKPHRVHVTITAPPVMKLEKELKFPLLVVYFSEPAARLDDLSKRAITGVRLDPQIRGAWRWSKDDTLFFEPAENWPAEQKFRVSFERSFFPRHVLMEKWQYEFATA
ncbi:MAG: hypothetical protein DLM52_08505, partial [Chthoniobacterales bacterium]